MSERVRIEHDAEGVLLARKRAIGEAAAQQLALEAEVLDRVRHPGVVEYVDVTDLDGDVAELDTVWVGGHSLETMRCRSAAQLASLMIGVTTTVADLHGMGVAHGSIKPSHVLVRSEGNPVLCGFGHTVELATADPHDRDAATRGDVAALGQMTQDLLDRDVGYEPTPDRRIRTILGPRRWPAGDVRALSIVAAAAVSEDSARPSARLLATMYRDAVPDATVDDATPPSTEDTAATPEGQDVRLDEPLDPLERLRPAQPGRQPRPPWLIGAAAAAVAGVLALGGIGLMGAAVVGFVDDAEPGRDKEARPADTAVTPSETSTHTTVVPTTLPSASSTRPAPTPDPDDIAISGQRVAWGDDEWVVGDPGDTVFVGDWDCDGTTTVALLRVDTGDVFLFDEWAGQDDSIVASHVRTVPDAITIHPPTGYDCDRPLVETEHGRMVPIDATGGAPR